MMAVDALGRDRRVGDGREFQARRLNSRSIPWAFTDLVAAAVQCLPSSVGKLDAAAQLAIAVREAEIAGALLWPEPARALFERCKAVLADRVPVLPAGVIGPALDTHWPDRPAAGWMRRRDIGTIEDSDAIQGDAA